MQRMVTLTALLLATMLQQYSSAQDIPVPPDLLPGDKYHLVFVTSAAYNVSSTPSFPPLLGEVNSLVGADWHVTLQAFQGGLLTQEWIDEWVANQANNIYTAIMSDSTQDAVDRFVVEGPVYNTNLDKIADDSADLWDGNLDNAIMYYETGVPVNPNSTDVWSGSTSLGVHSGASCGDWMDNGSTGEYGNANSAGAIWLGVGLQSCSSASRIYGISPAYCVPLVLGDVDQNGVVNLLDVGPFIDRVASGTYQFEADCNSDGAVNLLDVDFFIAILGGG